ncbi:MAG: 3-oxoacyl-[acyl-carrier-protein] synthase III C-terminal domain-containing protein [Kofleriaceae bacterium]
MKSRTNVGIAGLGIHLPSVIRTNDWWPPAVVKSWEARKGQREQQRTESPEMPPGGELVTEAMARYDADPFEGAIERRVMPDDQMPTDMQIAAGRTALASAGVAPQDVDFLLVQSTTSDYLHVPDGCRVHEQLGIATNCFTLQTDMMCSSFLQQLILAEALIHSGIGTTGLLIQCSTMSRHLRPEDPWSAWFGDAATAAVVKPARPGRGLLAHAHMTDGRYHGGLVTGTPNAHWWDGGQPIVHVNDGDRARGMVTAIPEAVKILIERALADADLSKSDVRFIATHQATIWLGEVVQRHAGLAHAARVDAFPRTTSVVGCNLPITLGLATERGLLRDDDPVVMFAGAAGMTAGAAVMRWGV